MTTTLRGTMLAPGVSRNGRYYTPDLIEKAYNRLVERLADPERPVTMLTHHAAGDDSTKIVGRVTDVALEGDQLKFVAEIAPTVDGKTISTLTTGKTPFLRNVSIRGAWLGPVISRMVDGQAVETADDMEIEGLDFTKNPGVTAAVIAMAESETQTTTENTSRTYITETARVTEVNGRTAIHEDADASPHAFADPGYAGDKIRRYPVTTETDARTSWARISEAANAAAYTPNQLKRVKGRIKTSLYKFGADMTETAATAAPVAEGEVRLSDITECYMDGTGTAGFSISAYNGPLTVSVSAYNGIEPSELGTVAQAAMSAAIAAVKAMDPDSDGDIDTGETASYGTQPDDDTMETHPDSPASLAEGHATAVAPTTKEPTVAETAAVTVGGAADADKTPAEEAAPAAPEIDYAKLAEAVAAHGKVTTEAAETDASEPLQETERAAEDALREQIKAELIAEARASGTLTRKGLVENIDAPSKPLHEMSEDEFRAQSVKVWDAVIPPVREQ